MKQPAAPYWFHGILFAAIVAADQLTKFWARARFSLPDGRPDYTEFIPILGDWIQFRLVYNYGAAFGTRPQEILPFLHPTVFYVLASAIALAFFLAYYRRLGPAERIARLGILLILAGAVGNLIDRVTMHRVTDFIDVGIPGVHPRWPVFNIADSSVCIGLALLILPPFFARRRSTAPDPSAPEAERAAPDRSGAAG